MLAANLKHLTDFLLLLGAFVGPVQHPRHLVPVKDKARALVLFAQKGDGSECRNVVAAIRRKKEETELHLAQGEKAIKELEASLHSDARLLEKAAGDLASKIAQRME